MRFWLRAAALIVLLTLAGCLPPPPDRPSDDDDTTGDDDDATGDDDDSGDDDDTTGDDDDTTGGDDDSSDQPECWSLRLDGVDDYVALTDVVAGLQAGTVELWFRPDIWPDRVNLWSASAGEPGQAGGDALLLGSFALYSDGIPAIRFGYYDPVDAWSWTDSTAVPAIPAWHHIASSWSPAGFALYLDGVEVGTNEYAGGAPSDGIAVDLLGASSWGNSYFAGDIATVRVSSTARYSEGFTPAFPMETDSSALALYDFSSGEAEWSAGTIHGGTWVEGCPGWGELPADGDGDGVTALLDCDDTDADNFPGNTEVCDGSDNDCDQATDEQQDADLDGLSLCDGDCDDGDAAIVLLTFDADCDGNVDALAAESIDFVFLTGGTFDMGCTTAQQADGNCQGNELPVREVTLTNDLWMSETEITQGEWQGLMGNNPSWFTSCGLACPVERVNWWEALVFANALSSAEGLPECYAPSGCAGAAGVDLDCGEMTVTSTTGSVYDCAGYRLPTQAEWEYAARAGSDLLYAGSDTAPDVAWYGTVGGSTHPVATKLPNAWGLYDLSGNAWEWTGDRQSTDYSSSLNIDPVGPSVGFSRVRRGGSFNSDATFTRVSYRWNNIPAHRNFNLGFRLVRTVPGVALSPDADADGSPLGIDCDDNDAANLPGNAEVCDGYDNDCDGATWATGGETDGDGDGTIACLDCDDAESSAFPGNPEVCDGIDNDCVPATFAAGEDTDGDGDGAETCLDCDDSDSTSFPGNTEVCDGVDNDCNTDVDVDDGGLVVDPGQVCVPEGPFWMGCAPGDVYCNADGREGPYHEVSLDAFLIGTTEVTVGEYENCMTAGVCAEPNTTGVVCDSSVANLHNWVSGGRLDHPINCVDWYDAVAYCTWVEGRLPTEAEWEKAARGTIGGVYPWGDTPVATCNRAVMSNTSGNGCGLGTTWPVGSLLLGASPYGALDMAGNVQEWTADYYSPTYYSGGPLSNPPGPATGSLRSVRVGAFTASASNQRASWRKGNELDFASYAVGFRCAHVEGWSPVDADGDGSPDTLDCDDADPSNYPGNTEVCDDADNDCDSTTWAVGEDTDGDADGAVTCLDCDDGDGSAFPGAAEVCDGQDNDCDGQAPGEADIDLDGFMGCEGDCDDGEAASFPGNTEVADGLDNDCDGLVDADDMLFVALPGGFFDMGCTAGQSNCFGNEYPVHTVTLTQGFWLADTEVTQGEWQALMGSNPSWFGPNGGGTDCGLDCPIELVDWYEALAFANAVSVAEGLAECYTLSGCAGGLGAGCTGAADSCWNGYECASLTINSSSGSPYDCEGYRLPTEAEWEYAARAGTDLLYAGSGQVSDVAWHSGNAGSTTHPVAQLLANGWGLFDLSGNVYEWTWDQYGGGYYSGSGPWTDPEGTGSGPNRVRRGSSYFVTSSTPRVALRGSSVPAFRAHHIGFRLARTVP